MTFELGLFEGSGREPLASRLRPKKLDEFVGQTHLLDRDKPLRQAIENGDPTSMVFWGPPGCGKTTLARLMANYTDRHFEAFSAVTEGVPRVREIIQDAQARQRREGRGTILFCDEIHRFNKGQQDAFLPWVEQGTITLIGATTENPSFELNSALLSRMKVYVLEPLSKEDIAEIVSRGWLDVNGEGERAMDNVQRMGARVRSVDGMQELSEDAVRLIVRYADGDARRALNAVEALDEHLNSEPLPVARGGAGGKGVSVAPSTLHVARGGAEGKGVSVAPGGGEGGVEPVARGEAGVKGESLARGGGGVGAEVVREVLDKRMPRYDKAGEEHYNIISAMHKAVRGSDVEGALYWLARMLAAGEDPLYVARRMVRMASEDIGMADPRALSVALAAKDAYHFLGSPEGELALAESAIYLATAPKSNKVYEAWSRASHAAREHPNEPVPLHIRNAPTKLMKELEYGKGYRYDHAEAGAHAAGQGYLPEELDGAEWYEPTDRGFEKTIRERIAWWKEKLGAK